MNKPLSALALAAFVVGAILLLPSCAAADSGPAGQAQMWEQNCNRCHNFRDPGSLSDQEWEIVVQHMRVRGNLTAEEHENIVSFLKAGN
ncbi:MAG: cytochrome c [Planctomycetes bacterium]|nr:cytochrome c [Planctomycetota bacterium]